MTRPFSLPRRAARSSAIRALLACAALLATFAVATQPAAAALPRRSATELHIDSVIKSLINRERAAHHLAAVSMVPQLTLSARRHNVTMAKYNELSHQLPGEPYFTTRFTRAGYYWSYAGENIAWNSVMTQAGVVQLQQAMYKERAPYNGHRLNILNRHYRNVGVDVYFDRRHHRVWLTTDFGHRR